MSEFLFFIIGTMLGGLFGVACGSMMIKTNREL